MQSLSKSLCLHIFGHWPRSVWRCNQNCVSREKLITAQSNSSFYQISRQHFNKMANIKEDSFSKRMRKETRDVHKISDALINAKLAFALSDNDVWADGLLVFYEIFRFLEEHTPEEFLPKEFHRTKSFESDLSFYLGDDWQRDYEIRNSVKMYLKHLFDVQKRSPTLLLAYVYHLYMGLLSGGQILQKKRSLNPLSYGSTGGDAVTRFDGYTIAELKTKMRSLVDEKALSFDESTKILLIAESKMVFHLNNEIVRSVRGVNRVSLRKFGIVLVVVIGLFYLLRF